MEMPDLEKCELVTSEEMENLVKKEIYEILLRSSVQKRQLHAVWSHRR